jgi:hypothetical protein
VKTLKYIILLFIIVFSFNACVGVTYPKNELAQSLEKLVKKDCDQDSKAYIVGKTLYLDMELDELMYEDDEIISRAIQKMQSAGLAIKRVVLSSDSDIKYMVVTAYNSYKRTAFRIVQNIDDVKDYFHMRISRSDFETRTLLETEELSTALDIIKDKHDITNFEYVGRLIASQLNIFLASDPGLRDLISRLSLRYADVESETLILTIFNVNVIDSKNVSLIKNILQEQVRNYSEKYNISFKRIKVVTSNGEMVLSM